jgi:hypothetical protein
MPPQNNIHPWLPHLNGLAAMVKARKQKNGYSLNEPEWDLSCKIPIESWCSNDSDCNETLLYHEITALNAPRFDEDCNEMWISASLGNLILQAQQVLQSAPSLFNSPNPESRANIEHLLEIALLRSASFSDWASKVSFHWQPRTVSYQIDTFELSKMDIYPSRIDVYPDCR